MISEENEEANKVICRLRRKARMCKLVIRKWRRIAWLAKKREGKVMKIGVAMLAG